MVKILNISRKTEKESKNSYNILNIFFTKKTFTFLLCIYFLFFGIALKAYASISVSQQATSTFAFLSSTSATLPSNPAVGDILCVNIDKGWSSSVSSVTGGGVTWSPMVSQAATSLISGAIWCGFNSTGIGKTVTVVFSATSSVGFTLVDFTGIPNPSMWVEDTSTTATGNSTALTTGLLIGTSQTPEIMIGMGGTNATGQGISAGPIGGFTTLTNIFDPPPNGSPLSLVSAWNLTTGTASISWTTNVSTRWVGMIVALEQVTTPTPPQNLTATPGDGQVSLSWSAPSSTGGSPITNYLVYDTLDSLQNYTLVATIAAPTTSTIINNLTNGSLYDFKVVAENAIGDSTASNVVNATPAETVPNPPQNLSATAIGNHIALSWSAPSSNGMPLSQYLVYYQLIGASTFTLYETTTALQTTSTVAGLTNGQSYNFEIVAANNIGNSLPSNIVTASPFVFPWPTSNNYNEDFTNARDAITAYITNHPSWFAHVVLTTDLAVNFTNGMSTTTAESIYNSARNALINAQGSGGQPILVGTYISGTVVEPQVYESSWPYPRVTQESMPLDAVYSGSYPGYPYEEIIDVTDANTVQALQAGIKNSWAEHPASLYMIDNAAANSIQGGTQPWQAQMNNLMGIREMANAMGSAVVFNISTLVGLMSDSDTNALIQAVGEGNAIMLEDPWDSSIQSDPTKTQAAVNAYRQILDSGIAVVMLPVSTSGQTLSSWIQTWRKPTDNLYIASAFYHPPDPLVSGPFLPINITTPTTNSTVSGSISVSATASSSYASISSVQFQLDGINLGAPIALSPYTTTWDTTQITNGAHTLSAIAIDGLNNTVTASGVNIIVDNIPSINNIIPTPVINHSGHPPIVSVSPTTNIEVPTSSSTTSPTSVKPKFTKLLKMNSKDNQVILLQDLLKKLGFMSKSAKSDGKFGKITLKALEAFQIKYKITKFGFPDYGQVGPKTRVKLNILN